MFVPRKTSQLVPVFFGEMPDLARLHVLATRHVIGREWQLAVRLFVDDHRFAFPWHLLNDGQRELQFFINMKELVFYSPLLKRLLQRKAFISQHPASLGLHNRHPYLCFNPRQWQRTIIRTKKIILYS